MTRPPATAPMMLPLIVAALVLAACAGTDGEEETMSDGMTLTSSAFVEDAAIPSRHGCDGADVSPPLAWAGAPDGTAAFAILVDDPDARGFVHWTLADLPADTSSLDEGAAAGIAGRTDFGRTGWGGPCPPSGTHRYVFEVFALSEPLGLQEGFSADELRAALEGRVLASGRLTGTYRRGG